LSKVRKRRWKVERKIEFFSFAKKKKKLSHFVDIEKRNKNMSNEEQSEKIQITLHVDHAQNLYNADTGVLHPRSKDVSDPYVVVSWSAANKTEALADQQAASSTSASSSSSSSGADDSEIVIHKVGKTPTIQNDLNPVWAHDFELELPSTDVYVKFEVYDKDAVGADYLGECELALWEHCFENESEEDVWMQLRHGARYQGKLSWKPQGSLRVSVTPHNMPDEVIDEYHLIGFPEEDEVDGWRESISNYLASNNDVAEALIASHARSRDRHQGNVAKSAAFAAVRAKLAAANQPPADYALGGDDAALEAHICSRLSEEQADRILANAEGYADEPTPPAVSGSPAAAKAEGVPEIGDSKILWRRFDDTERKHPVMRVPRVATRVVKGRDGQYRSSKLIIGSQSQIFNHMVSAPPKALNGSSANLLQSVGDGTPASNVASSSSAATADDDQAAESGDAVAASSDEAKPTSLSAKKKNPFETPKHPPKHDAYDWANWGDTIFIQYRRRWHPETLIDIRQAIASARAARVTIRCVAHAHSWAPVFTDTGNDIMFMDRLVGLQKNFPAKEEDWEVTVLSGTSTGALSSLMRKNGVFLPSNVISQQFLFGGLLSTGSHGSGWDLGLILDFLKRIEIVDSNAQLRTFTKDDPDWKYVVLNLGLFGILYSVTFRVWPERKRALNIDYAIDMGRFWARNAEDQSKEIWRRVLLESHYLELFWFPFNKDMWVKIWNFTDQQPKWRPFHVVWTNFEQWAQAQVGRLANPVVASKDAHWPVPKRTFSAITPAYSRAAFRMIASSGLGTYEKPKYQVTSIQDAIHWRTQLDAIPLYNMEFAFELPALEDGSTDFESLRRAWFFVVDLTNSLAESKDPNSIIPNIGNAWPLNVTLECRFGAGTCAHLGNNKGNHRTAFFEWVSGVWTPGWKEFCNHIGEWMMVNLKNARCHWGKYQQDFPDAINRLHRDRFADDYDEFVAARTRLGVDPDEMFTNEWLRAVFALPEPYSRQKAAEAEAAVVTPSDEKK
jgi:C2 domain/FAD binding domain/D-arabinono-1,4-lactone oxidase